MVSSDSQMDKPRRRRPKTAKLPDVNINTGAQNNTERAFLKNNFARGHWVRGRAKSIDCLNTMSVSWSDSEQRGIDLCHGTAALLKFDQKRK